MRFNSYNDNTPVWLGISLFFVGIIMFIGWVANIVKLFGMANATDPNLVMAIIRAVGIIVGPLGSILGLFV